MSGLFDTLASVPLPYGVALVITFACLAGFWFFVIPAMEELNTLRQENRELRDQNLMTVGDGIESLVAQLKEVVEKLHSDPADSIHIEEILRRLDSQNNLTISAIETGLNNIKTLLGHIETSLQRGDTNTVQSIQAEMSRLHRMISIVSDEVMTLSSKQSQTNGLLSAHRNSQHRQL
jgi:Tfp pilus assembly protein PilO